MRSFIMFCLLLSLNTNINTDTFEEWKKNASLMPVYTYPYAYLPELLKEEGQLTLPIFTYGSLMDEKSARRTLSEETWETRKPAVAFGVIRVFDRDVPIEISPKWGEPIDPQARGMLNLLFVDNDERTVNGLVIDVPLQELCNILKREDGYDLVPVVVAEWHDAACYRVAYTFRAPQDSIYTDATIAPRPGYYELTRDAAAKFGEEFHQHWFESTFFADGETPIGEWEKDVVVGDAHTKAK